MAQVRDNLGSRGAGALWLPFALHNVEEVLRFPAWVGRHGEVFGAALPSLIAARSLTLATLFLTVLAAILVPWLNRRPWALAVVSFALLANVLSHLAIALMTWSVAPGLVSALLLLFPAGVWVLLGLGLPPRALWITGLAGAVLMPLAAASALFAASLILPILPGS